MSYLTEEQLNLYLDNELSTVERAAVEAHLAGCDACRAELASLQTLFTALGALQPEALAADLTPLVLRGVAAERRRTVRRRRISWLVPALQGAAVVLLLVFGWSALATRYAELAQRIPAEALYAAWTNALARGGTLWAATVAWWQTWWAGAVTDVLGLPASLGQVTSHWPQLPGLGFTTSKAIAVSLAAALVWLVGNAILLRMAAVRQSLNRHLNHQ
ncbi:MAG: anti-sigma factor [Anaerolineae bacterium]